jgi:glycine oxidase
MRSDIAVIGGGINGLAIARELAARYGASVTLFDDSKLGAASRAAAGLLGAQAEGAALPADRRPALFPLLRRSLRLHEFLDAYLRAATGGGSGYRAAGALHVARDERELEALAARYAWQRDFGAEALLLTGREARHLEPSLSPSVAGGVLLPDEAVVDPGAMLGSLRRACAGLGVRSVAERVRRVACEGGRVRALQTDGATFAVDAAVIAAGGWLGGLEGLPRQLAPVGRAPGTTVVLRGRPRHAGRVIVSAQGYVVPRADGSLALGSTLEGADPHEDVLAALYSAVAVMPALASCRVGHTRIGYRPRAPGGLPWVGRTEIEGLFVATGNARNGLLLAPSTAAHVADLLAGASAAPGPFAPPPASARHDGGGAFAS